MFTPKAKRRHQDSLFSSYSSRNAELIMPSEVEKLKKIFPFLDQKVTIDLWQALTPLCSNWKKCWRRRAKTSPASPTGSFRSRVASSMKNAIRKTLLLLRLLVSKSTPIYLVAILRVDMAPMRRGSARREPALSSKDSQCKVATLAHLWKKRRKEPMSL